VNILRLYEDHYWGETYCSECGFNIYGTSAEDIVTHLENQHSLIKETPENYTHEEFEKIDELFGSVCCHWFTYYRHTETGELWAVRNENN
jgi:hypothetical protein